MLHIAICDNDPLELRQLADALAVCAAQGQAVTCQQFTSGVDLLESLGQGMQYDAVLLDILMPEMSGIELGARIREAAPDTYIIYTTSTPDFALQAYGNHALRYLLKPVQPAELASALELVASLCENKQPTILIHSTSGIVTTTPDKIILAENVARTVQYQLADGSKVQTISRRGKMDESVDPLPTLPEFIKPHNSFWINMNYIRKIERDDFVMDNGAVVPISRSRQAEVKRAYLKFLEASGGRL